MSKFDLILEQIKKVLDLDTLEEKNIWVSQNYINPKSFIGEYKNIVTEICSIQDCNMGGSYYRNYFISDGKLYNFISSTDFFNSNEYNKTVIEKYIYKWNKIE